MDGNDKFVTVHNKCSKIPPPTSMYFGCCCAKIRFKQLYLSNHSQLVTCTYELSFLTTTNTITSHSIEIPLESPCIYVHGSEKI